MGVTWASRRETTRMHLAAAPASGATGTGPSASPVPTTSREEDARAASGVPSRDLTDQPKDAA